jgi:hypothetical protein
VPEEQDIHTDHDRYQRKHVKHDGCLSPHCFVLLCAPEWSKSDAEHALIWAGVRAFVWRGGTGGGADVRIRYGP